MAQWFDRPEGPILRVYEWISGPSDKERSSEEFRALFLPDARLRVARRREDGSEWVGEFSPEEFATAAKAECRGSGLWEREIARRVDSFGSIAHVWSTYESRVGAPESAPVARGINSVQLWHRDGRWRIVGLIWDFERTDEPIPARYLKPVSSDEISQRGAT